MSPHKNTARHQSYAQTPNPAAHLSEGDAWVGCLDLVPVGVAEVHERAESLLGGVGILLLTGLALLLGRGSAWGGGYKTDNASALMGC